MAPLSEEVIPLIKAYLAEYHGARLIKDSPFIYTVQHGKRNRMSERNVERIVKNMPIPSETNIRTFRIQFILICSVGLMQQVCIVMVLQWKPLHQHLDMPAFRQQKIIMLFRLLNKTGSSKGRRRDNYRARESGVAG